MGYSAKAVANYFLEQYGGTKISPLKIQKLVYIAHGWHWAFHDKPLVSDEHAEAWEYGPVFASLFHEFKHLGRDPIKGLAMESDIDESQGLVVRTPRIPLEDERTCRFLDKVWEEYGGHSASALSTICHRQGTPWHKARQDDYRRNAHIDDDEIKLHYVEKRKQNLNRQEGLNNG